MIKRDNEGRIVSVHTETREIVQHITDRSVIESELESAEADLAAAQSRVNEITQDLAEFDRINSEVAADPATPNSEAA